MKWFAAWWGVEIFADNQKDEELLKELLTRLSKKAEQYYENGKIHTCNKSEIEADASINDPHIGFTISFSR